MTLTGIYAYCYNYTGSVASIKLAPRTEMCDLYPDADCEEGKKGHEPRQVFSQWKDLKEWSGNQVKSLQCWEKKATDIR